MSAPTSPTRHADVVGGVSPAGLLRAEVLRLRSSRALPVLGVLLLLVPAATCWAMAGQDPAEVGGAAALAQLCVFAGYSLVPYVVAFLACAAVTGEFTSGVSRVVLGGVPTRWPVLAARAAVGSVVALGLGAVSLAAGAAVLWATGVVPGSVWRDPGVLLLPVAGALAGCVCLSLIGTAVGATCRRGPVSAVVLVALLLAAPPLLGGAAAAAPWVGDLSGMLPLQAANRLVGDRLTADTVGRTTAAAVLLAWVCAWSAVAVWSIRRADL